MQQIVVKPPAAAARAPLSIVSACSIPGSRRCTCMSMKPGATISPDASNTSAPAESSPAAFATTRPFSSARSATASNPEAGSITRPFLIKSLLTDDPFEHRHADGDAVFHLIENYRALRIGHFGGQLPPPVDRAGMHDDHVRLGQLDVLQAEPVKR